MHVMLTVMINIIKFDVRVSGSQWRSWLEHVDTPERPVFDTGRGIIFHLKNVSLVFTENSMFVSSILAHDDFSLYTIISKEICPCVSL